MTSRITPSAAVRPFLRRSALVCLPILLLAAVTLLRLAPPETHIFYPVCPFHQLTGLLCPGCGATRALAALVRGDLASAWHANQLLLLLLPAAALTLSRAYLRLLCGSALHAAWPAPPRAITWLLLATALVFTVARNLDPAHHPWHALTNRSAPVAESQPGPLSNKM